MQSRGRAPSCIVPYSQTTIQTTLAWCKLRIKPLAHFDAGPGMDAVQSYA